MTIFASTPATRSARLKGRPNPALLDFRQLHGEKRGEDLRHAAIAWHASMSTMVMAGAYGYREGAHARLVLVRLASFLESAGRGFDDA